MTADPPRISVNELAKYMVSSDTARLGIIRRARKPKKFLMVRYSDARNAIRRYLVEPRFDPEPLREAEKKLSQRALDPSMSPMRQDDAHKSIDVLRRIQAMQEELEGYSFVRSPGHQSKLPIGNVQVSVHADLLVHGSMRGRDEVGAAVLRMTKDDAFTPTSKEKRRIMGQYVATLARMHVENLAVTGRVPSNRLSMSIDVQHGAVFTAPRHYARRRKELESACVFISGLWGAV